MAASATPTLFPKRRWRRTAGALALGLLVALAIGAFVLDASRRQTIAPGIRAAGVSVGGLHASKARELLARELPARLERPVVVRAGRRFSLDVAAPSPGLTLGRLWTGLSRAAATAGL